MAFCINRKLVDEFKKALRVGEIDPAKLTTMDSLQRRAFLEKYVGKESAVETNALFESKLLLKNQKAGMISWAKKIAGLTTEAKRDIISKIERLDKVLDPKAEEVFLKDLASTRLGVDVTQIEAKTISDFSKKISELKTKANEKGVFTNETDRFSYGLEKYKFEEYFNDLKLKTKEGGIKAKIIETGKEIPGILKSAQSALDNSFFGRQGIKVLYNNPSVWIRNFIKSWGDIGKELKGENAMAMIKADIYSRPNAINGKYTAGGYGIDVLSEEAYPSSLPSKIPALGRLFKASESAYNGAALRIRADLADRFIKMAEDNGVNTLSKVEARPIGDLVGSLTGRGKIDWLTPKGSKIANVLLYSVKFLKSNFDTLLAPFKHVAKKVFGKYETKGAEFAGKMAAKSSLRIVGTIATVLTISKLLNPDSVDEDPTSTNFGKIKMWGHWVDISGGMGSIVRLGARMVFQRSKSSTGKITEYKAGFGARTFLDEIEDFTEGKLSPIAGILRDAWKKELFGGEKFTWAGALKQAMTPLPVQNAEDILKDPKSEFVVGSIILDGLGLSTSTNTVRKTDWSLSTGKELEQFKKKVGDIQFKKANEDYNKIYQQWYDSTTIQPSYKNLSEEEKTSLITKAKEKVKQTIFKANRFKYKAPRKNRNETQKINKLLP